MKKQIFTALLAAVAMVFFFLPFTSLAQQATTSLNGVVTDPSGSVLSGATVTISRAATGQTLTTTTDARGAYRFAQLSSGTWTVTISAKGFADQSKVGTLLVSKPAT
ncbi:MAG: carboxypeptidase-like regulatory domain-containing protein, partial [Acidobacteriaceae bacterium]